MKLIRYSIEPFFQNFKNIKKLTAYSKGSSRGAKMLAILHLWSYDCVRKFCGTNSCLTIFSFSGETKCSKFFHNSYSKLILYKNEYAIVGKIHFISLLQCNQILHNPLQNQSTFLHFPPDGRLWATFPSRISWIFNAVMLICVHIFGRYPYNFGSGMFGGGFNRGINYGYSRGPRPSYGGRGRSVQIFENRN